MKPKHTAEPWRENGQTVFASNGDYVCTCGDCVHDEHQANAARIAACVNALAGIEDPEKTVPALRDALVALTNLVDMICSDKFIRWDSEAIRLCRAATDEAKQSGGAT